MALFLLNPRAALGNPLPIQIVTTRAVDKSIRQCLWAFFHSRHQHSVPWADEEDEWVSNHQTLSPTKYQHHSYRRFLQHNRKSSRLSSGAVRSCSWKAPYHIFHSTFTASLAMLSIEFLFISVFSCGDISFESSPALHCNQTSWLAPWFKRLIKQKS